MMKEKDIWHLPSGDNVGGALLGNDWFLCSDHEPKAIALSAFASKIASLEQVI